MPQVLVNNVYFCRKERAALQLKHSVPVPACAAVMRCVTFYGLASGAKFDRRKSLRVQKRRAGDRSKGFLKSKCVKKSE